MQTGTLIVFTRYPAPGRAKTRLIPALGPAGAADLMRRLTAHTLQQAQAFAASHLITLLVSYDGGTLLQMQKLFGPHLSYRPQAKGDLGSRLLAALTDVLAHRRQPVVIIGSDCPDLTEATLAAAFYRLQHHDLVLGPALDGGYYLIGLKDLHAPLFQTIPWGTAQVLALTLQQADRLGLHTALLPTLRDIDRPADLPFLPPWLRS
ncbi:MAG: TIGR04282 family arsenosugar biosynthesis glycosyltransferase [Desulfobacca sp.]|uniref:TIGR04282 family arsenosugar biosynthesis glycosyltransferase n=1 Tax=Desulfobacca sp. TaxID=2067990 RepID=UPI00404AB288